MKKSFTAATAAALTALAIASCASSQTSARSPEACAANDVKCSTDKDCCSLWCVNGECQTRDP
jgi:hypothetical protein